MPSNAQLHFARIVEPQWPLMVSSMLTSSNCSKSADSVVSQPSMLNYQLSPTCVVNIRSTSIESPLLPKKDHPVMENNENNGLIYSVGNQFENGIIG